MLLTQRKFLPLFLTQFLGALNDNLLKMAIITFITYHLQGSLTEKGILISSVNVITILPMFFISATAGQFADKFQRNSPVKIIKGIEILGIFFCIFFFYSGQYSLILLTLFVMSTRSAFFGPLKYSILPQHLKEAELISANAFVDTSTYLAVLFGTILGTYLHSPIFVLGFLFSSAVIGFISSFFIPVSPAPRPKAKLHKNILKDIRISYRKVSELKVIYQTILGISWFWSLAAVVMLLIYPLCESVLGTSRNAVSVFMLIFALGISLGAYLCTKILKGVVHPTYVPLSSLGMAVSMFALYWATNRYVPPFENLHTVPFFTSFVGIRMAIILFLLAFFSGMYLVPLNTFLQTRASKKYLATIIAGNNILNACGMVFLSVFVMLLFHLGVSIPQIFFFLSLVSILVAFYILTMLPDALPRSIAQSLLAIFFKVDVKGLEYFEKAGKRVLLIANHTSLLDGLLVAAFMPERLIFAINTHIAKKWWVKIFRPVVSLHPLDPTNPVALKNIIDELKKNQKCIIFPEGRITVTGSLMKVYEGAGVVANAANANILPVRIDGAQFSKFSYLKTKFKTTYFPKITITVLPPTKIKVEEGVSPSLRRKQIGDQLYTIMTNMMYQSSPIATPLFRALLTARKRHGKGHMIAEDIARRSISYYQLILKSYILGRYFEEKIPEKNVALLLPNSLANVIAYFALQSVGKVPAMVNFTQGEAQILSCLHTSGIQTLITAEKMVTLMELQAVIQKIEEAGIRVFYLEQVQEALSYRQKWIGVYRYYRRYTPKVDSSDIATILFTSGSEGTPKAVALNHENLQANRYQISSVFAFNESDVFFNMLPMFHSFGLEVGTILPILSGIKVFFYPSPVHYKIVPELVYDSNASILCGTDTFFQGYAKQANPYDFYNIKYAIVGAEKLKDTTSQIWMEKFGVRILEGYGITETSPVLAVNTPMYQKKNSVGKLVPGIQYRLEEVEGVAEGGRLFVKGRNIMKGYLKNGELESLPDGWYDTGDIVSIDEDGFVHILGRAKRFAKIGGEMVSLAAVEEVLQKKYPDIKLAVLSVQDPKKGEQLVLFTEAEQMDSKDILEYLKEEQYSELWIPKKILTKQEIPILGTGKTDYVKLREMLDTE